MIINTFSAFYYGHLVTTDNQIIPFDEGAGEINATIEVGSYTLTGFVSAVQSALNEFGSNEYQVTVNRSTRRITITSNNPFTLLFGSSLQTEISCRELMGFNIQNYSGSIIQAPLPSGFAYYPQFKLQEFVDFDNIRRSNSPTVKTSASGRVEVVKYSNSNFMRCNITLITNITGQAAIKNNPNGVQDAIQFMNYATDKNQLEFIYNENDPSVYVECLLESTSESQTGTDFELRPLYSRGLTGYYELNNLLFRRLV
jgi:hypothetical protein